ncbi:MAG: pyridoxine/pyridoxamine 5'-phosphate oxidase [Oligoflexia bacterium]|nr:MAG: pyridoxine/pyridoxamine 5'-phosphate oxidase [Oligoflexia bacterium]
MFERQLDLDPIKQFQAWYTQACSYLWLKNFLSRFFPPIALHQPDAMVLATVTSDGKPDARVVLLKGIEKGQFLFYTNYDSRKGKELSHNPHVALVFQWCYPERQVRIEGRVKRLSYEESSLYFSTRPRGSQIGAIASQQSEVIQSREVLEHQVREVEKKYEDQEIPCPTNWGGFAVEPSRIEFWQARLSRLHDRLVYIKSESGWERKRLSP